MSTRLHEDGTEVDGKREAQGEDVGEGVREGVNEKRGVLLLGDALSGFLHYVVDSLHWKGWIMGLRVQGRKNAPLKKARRVWKVKGRV